MKKRKIPTVLTYDEVNTFLSKPDVSTLPGLRDKTILEIIYGSGLRVSELINLQVNSIIPRESLCRVIGKGNKERNVPVTASSLKWLDKYLTEVRAYHPAAKTSSLLFPNHSGKPLSRQAIWDIVNKYADLTAIDKNIHPHTLRHSIATHLYSKGMDLLKIRDLLGHENISTTQIYTHISITHLQTAYKQFHPRR